MASRIWSLSRTPCANARCASVREGGSPPSSRHDAALMGPLHDRLARTRASALSTAASASAMHRHRQVLADFFAALFAASRASAFFACFSAREMWSLAPFAAFGFSFGSFAALGAFGSLGGLGSN